MSLLVPKHETMGIKGIHKISICKMVSDEAKKIQTMIDLVAKSRLRLVAENASPDAFHKQWEEYNYWVEQLHRKFLVRQSVTENVTATVGRGVLAARLAGIVTNTGVVNYGALGTNATGALVGNTKLGTEVFRKPLSSGTSASNVAVLENFYTALEVVNTFQEYGFFIDGTGTVDSGILFNHWTAVTAKSNIETMNTQSTVTFNST